MRRDDQHESVVVFVPDRALRDAVDPGFAEWEKAWREPLLRMMRESTRARREKERRMHGREHRIPKAVRRAIYQRDAEACVRCGAEVGWEEWRCHHVTPYPAGNESVENLATLCPDCHEWLHDGFVDSPTAKDRLREFRRWWGRRADGSSSLRMVVSGRDVGTIYEC